MATRKIERLTPEARKKLIRTYQGNRKSRKHAQRQKDYFDAFRGSDLDRNIFNKGINVFIND